MAAANDNTLDIDKLLAFDAFDSVSEGKCEKPRDEKWNEMIEASRKREVNAARLLDIDQKYEECKLL